MITDYDMHNYISPYIGETLTNETFLYYLKHDNQRIVLASIPTVLKVASLYNITYDDVIFFGVNAVYHVINIYKPNTSHNYNNWYMFLHLVKICAKSYFVKILKKCERTQSTYELMENIEITYDYDTYNLIENIYIAAKELDITYVPLAREKHHISHAEVLDILSQRGTKYNKTCKKTIGSTIQYQIKSKLWNIMHHPLVHNTLKEMGIAIEQKNIKYFQQYIIDKTNMTETQKKMKWQQEHRPTSTRVIDFPLASYVL
jgi:hypothetical protein